ncbi:nucleolus and neural progenitor protein isoform X1 [Pelobates fuscus]|uniref:nucleolus and neural progenitor protein isoform X1 n=2 Tax=Pelobates fuscus TaxID=191477 RepID=UPI002FE4F772
MTSEPWNRLHMPRPAIQSSIQFPLGTDTEKHIKHVVERSLAVQSSLRSHILKTEIAALHSLLYVFHHRLSLHKPYLALKQVDQCIKRIESMGLDGSIQEILDLCPYYIGKNESETTQYYSVPSQPIIELASVKIVGACKLLLRLLDCCCKTFHLCIQHLYHEEFIVLNVVLLGLLSRFWVLYRGILKKLVSLYDSQFSLQHEISSFQNMPYINFTFPAKMEDYLGPVFTDLAGRKLPKITSKKELPKLLNKMFSSRESNSKVGALKKPLDMPKARIEVIDLGRPMDASSSNRGTLGTFDVKTLCKSLKSKTLQKDISNQSSRASRKTWASSSAHRIKAKCVRHIVPKIKKADCFRDLCEQLQHAVAWCKQKRLAAECMFFRNKYLRSNRWMHTEVQGYCLKNKLKHFKKSICHSLHKGILKSNQTCRRLESHCFQRTWKHKVTHSGRTKPPNYGPHYNTYSQPASERSGLCLDLVLHDQGLPSTITETNSLAGALETKCRKDNSDDYVATNTDDIDDIFSSIGI